MGTLSDDEIIKILSKIPFGTSLYRINKLYVLMCLIRNNGNRTNTVKDVKISMRTVRNRIYELRYDGFRNDELLNRNVEK